MTHQKTLAFYQAAASRNSAVNESIDQILNQVLEQTGLEARADWPEIRQTVELFTFTGLVLENPSSKPAAGVRTCHASPSRECESRGNQSGV